MLLMFATQISFAPGIKRNRAGKPADGNQAQQFRFARFELENRDGVLRAVADKKCFARFVKRQRVWLRAEQIAGILPRANRFDDLVGARVNDAQRVVCRRWPRPASVRSATTPARRRAGRSRFRIGADVAMFASSDVARSITDTEPSLAMQRASTRTRVPAGRAGDAVGVGPAAAPVAHVNFVPAEHDVKRRNAHVPNPQDSAGYGVQFGQPVGKIAAQRKFFCRPAKRRCRREFHSCAPARWPAAAEWKTTEPPCCLWSTPKTLMSPLTLER